MDVRKELFKYQDIRYADLQAKLIPNIDKEKIIGVRMPRLRKTAEKAAKCDADIDAYYYEEFMVIGMAVGYKNIPIEKRFELLDDFVPLIDNWAVCDSCASVYKFTKNHMSDVWEYIQKYKTGAEFERRFAAVMMLDYFICGEYIDSVIKAMVEIQNGEYYADMAVAWALSAAYVTYKKEVTELLKSKKLSPWVQNKTIQKIRESYRVDEADKDFLKMFKIKTVKPNKNK